MDWLVGSTAERWVVTTENENLKKCLTESRHCAITVLTQLIHIKQIVHMVEVVSRKKEIMNKKVTIQDRSEL